MAYDVITGISVGSLNAYLLSLFPKGDEKEALDYAAKLWKIIDRKSVWQMWPIYKLPLVLLQDGLVDNSPLETFIRKSSKGKSLKRRLYVGASDIRYNEFIRFTNEDMTTMDDAINVLMSSVAIPVFFPF